MRSLTYALPVDGEGAEPSKMAGDYPNFAQSSEQNGTALFSEAIC